MKPLIQVCGDPTVDWFRIHNENIIVRGGVYFWKKKQEGSRMRMSSKPGGAAMVLQLLKEMISEESASIEGLVLDEELLERPKNDSITTSWTLWKEYANPGLNSSAFRLVEWQEFEPGVWDYEARPLTGSPQLLLIQDSGLGFRYLPGGWPEALSNRGDKRPQHIIFKLGQYGDLPDNPLLNRIEDLGLDQHTTMVTSLSDLRSCAVKVGISLSWERILEEVVAAVRSSNGPFWDRSSNQLKYKQVVVTIGASGAVIVSHEANTLVFDCRGQEGDFAAQYPGQMIGYNTCVLGALAAGWIENRDAPDWTRSVYWGIALARLLHIKGLDVVADEDHESLQYPYAMLTKAYREWNHKSTLLMNPVSNTLDLGIFVDDQGLAVNPRTLGKWTILEKALLKTDMVQQDYLTNIPNIEAVSECAGNIVVYGPRKALPQVPIEMVGSWYSADRQEVEGVRSVNNAMKIYLQLEKSQTPLCVAVFGPPGAGKSFVIKEIAKGLGLDADAQLTFNLSQFGLASELQNAFNQIRDLNLKGKTPLVFWDEFDTPCEGQPLGWLQYFLAPMQDGEFTDQGRTHPLGRGIYVFAGATRFSFEDFRAGNDARDRQAKKPDFISRLRAYINIRGINGDPNTVEDRLYMIRRAFILRQYLEAEAPRIKAEGKIEIEAGVLDAFLRVSQYLHGARSLDNLVKMSSLYDKRKYELSSLPPDHILKMHVNMEEFNALTRMGHREMLRIGISGHINLDPNQMENLKQAVQEAIDFIEQQFPNRYLTVFSPLAIGSDRLVARELLKKENSRLIAVLPVPQEEYIFDFGLTDDYWVDPKGAELRKEFKYWLSERATEIINIPPLPSRKEAYLRAGYFIAEHSDVMIVVWDGQRNLESSVTAQIVARAEKLHKPLCHVWARNNKLESSWSEGIDKHGQVRYKRFSCAQPTDWLDI
ncbi:MAG: ATP-binding protein [Syntrophomonadaceae bacterium]|nr:ATP-binding protein [Syntrophomonadaceae bacterium]